MCYAKLSKVVYWFVGMDENNIIVCEFLFNCYCCTGTYLNLNRVRYYCLILHVA